MLCIRQYKMEVTPNKVCIMTTQLETVYFEPDAKSARQFGHAMQI